MRLLVVGRRGADEHHLPHALLELGKLQRPVVQRAGQAESVFDQRGLARLVAVVHGVQLADHLVALVQEHDGIARQVVGQRGGRIARRGARQMARVVLDALAVAQLAQHLQIEPRALLQPLRLDQLAFGDEELEALGQLQLDRFDRRQRLLARRHVVAAGVDDEARHLLLDAAGERVEQADAFHLVVEQLHAHRQLAVFGREHVDGVAAHAEGAAREVHVVALVLHAHQLRDGVALALLATHLQDHPHLQVVVGRADAVDGRHRGHDHRVAPLQHALGGRQAHLLDVLVDRAVLLDEQVALRHIGLGLVVVIIADEVLDRVPGEELAELAVQLRRQRLVGREHDRRPPQPRDHVGHGEGLARTGHAQQGLERFAVLHALDQRVDGRGLVARRRIRLEKLKRRVGEGDELAGGRRLGRCDGGHTDETVRGGPLKFKGFPSSVAHAGQLDTAARLLSALFSPQD